MWENAAEESKTSRTFAEAIKLSSAVSCSPASNALELKLNVATHLSLLWAIFGEMCHLYQKVLHVYNILRLPTVMTAKHAYTVLLCRQITWAIYIDSHNFFLTRLHPNDFTEGKQVMFPISLLDDIKGDIRFGRPILCFSFPPQWSKADIQGAKLSGSGGPVAPTSPNPFYKGAGGLQPQPQQQTQGRSGGDNLSNVHPDIPSAMQEYHNRVAGRVAVQRLLEAANLTFKDLPYLTNLLDPGGKTGCVTITV
jgi:hypothetical protein